MTKQQYTVSELILTSRYVQISIDGVGYAIDETDYRLCEVKREYYKFSGGVYKRCYSDPSDISTYLKRCFSVECQVNR